MLGLGSSKKVANAIEEIRNWALVQVPAKIQKENLTEEQYLNDCRLVLNIMVIQTLIGAEFDKAGKDGRNKIKFNRPMPTQQQVAEIVEIMNQYISTVEDPFLEVTTVEDEDDMSIDGMIDSVEKIDKINKKKMVDAIFGYNGQQAIVKMLIDPIDIIRIDLMGKDLRKKCMINRTLIIGGITLFVAGAGAGAFYLINKNNKDDSNIDVEGSIDPDTMIDIDPDQVPDIDPDTMADIDPDQVPVVTMD